MGSTYAFLVDCPRVFGSVKHVVLAASLQGAIKWLDDHMRAVGMPDSRIDSIVCVGEVING